MSTPPTTRRFYRTVGISEQPGGFDVRLDDKPVRTPAGASLLLPTRALAEAIAEEWRAQETKIDPSSMPMLQLANSAIDRVAGNVEAIVDQLAAYGETDLVCHWAPDPPELVARQRQHWQPLLDWAALELDAPLRPVEGIVARPQPKTALEALRAAVAAQPPFRLAALYLLTTVTGSLVIGLAALAGRIDPEAAWQAAQLDELFQAERWGEDEEAAARRTAEKADLMAATRFLGLLDR